jgi:hypothetical protein
MRLSALFAEKAEQPRKTESIELVFGVTREYCAHNPMPLQP